LLDLVSVIGDAALPERADRLRQGMTLLAFVQSDLTAAAESGGRKLRDHMERNLRRLSLTIGGHARENLAASLS
jgi:hypothetical protein